MKIFPVYLWTGGKVATMYRCECTVGRVKTSTLAHSRNDALGRALKEIMRPAGF